jgi:uncharacterized protein (TIGR03032 family)
MSNSSEQAAEYRDIRCSYSASLPELLTKHRISLLITTYQTGHLIVLHARQNQLNFAFHQFERAMGVAYKPGLIAICTAKEVWLARNAPDLAAKLEPRGHYDAFFLARTTHFTGDIGAHETAWIGNELWIVNTSFSCLCALHNIYSFAPRWRPPFITAYAPEDRCHLNGMAVVDGKPKYVTALGESDVPKGYRDVKEKSGCIMEVPSGRVVARGLAAPHSPRVHDGRLLVLNSGHGRLEAVDPSTGNLETVAKLQGFSRGMGLHAGLAFIGLSKMRPTWSAVPLNERGEEMKCGMTVVDLKTGNQVAHLDINSGVDEVFDVAVLPGITAPYFSGPSADKDVGQPMWTIPAG